uniref:Ciliogenesis and planar polarity effector 1 n=1 Tax=Poecilia formosa TaxID=48698 RepID=A0A087YPH0_POEFO
MELKLEVVLSSSIKRKKPWPRFCWLGQEKESVFLLDDKRISEINMMSGRTKKKMPKLHPLLSSVVKMTSSHNGMWLCGLLVSGELFLWNRDKDLLKTAAAVPEVVQIINSAQGNSLKLCLQVSCDGTRVLLAVITGQVFLWECTEGRDFPGVRDGAVKGRWAHLLPLEETILPSSNDKEASQHVVFVKTEIMDDICLSAFVFTSGKQLVVTILKIQWSQGRMRVGSVGYSIRWASKTYPMSHLCPPCQPVKSRGALVPAFSPDGRLLAIVLNQRKPKDTQVLFVSTQNFVSISTDLGGCGSKKLDIPSKYVRSYWVSCVSWSAEGLFFACVLKRGSLLVLARLGGLLTLTSSGCNVDFGPAHFLPLHPLVTYRPPLSAENREASLSSSSLSLRDLLRQRFSVTWHPRLPYLIVSDGYMATVMKVQDKHSPGLFLKALLKETYADLEKTSCKLEKSQGHVKVWLESVSWFNSDGSLEEPKASDSTNSAAADPTRLPLFLQDQQTLGGTKELLENMEALFEEDSDLEGLPAGSRGQEGGRLEFASMFDTLHAVDTHSEFGVDSNHKRQPEKKNRLHSELGKIQRKLLTAWAFAMSIGDAVEHRVALLKHTLCCVVWFAALLHLVPSREKNSPAFGQLLHLVKALLSFLHWDGSSSGGQHCLGLMVEFSERIVRLLLTPQPDIRLTGHSHVSSQSLSRMMQILRLISDSLDHTYSLEQKTYWSSEEEFVTSQPHLWCSDVHHVPLLQDVNADPSAFEHQALPVPQRPSSRLLGVWQLVYDVAQQYAEELKRFKDCDGLEEEEQKLSVITSQIQTALQATGENLEEGRSLLSYQGEHLFLCGLYSQSTQMLRLQICQEASKGGNRSVFQETRLCLALLYSLLSRYQLREAQEFGDHMAQLILLRDGNRTDNFSCISATDPLPCPWLPIDLPSDSACAVIQALGRFMAAYFTNQPLFILPAHNVAVLPPLHLPLASSIGRLVSLCQEEAAKAVRQQHLSEVWTVDYAQDLLLLGGLLPEAVWLASHLGDWKTAVTLSLAYTNYCAKHLDFTLIRRRDFLLPAELQPESIFQAELRGLLGSKTDLRERTDKDDPMEGEDWEVLQASAHEILKASAMAGVNVMSFPLSTLLDKVKDMCLLMPTLVPDEVYLPSPPLYCPQPSPNTQDQMGEMGPFAELVCRHKVSGVLQRLLLLLRSAHCCRPAAQWYISRLRRARHVLHKIKKKYSYPSAAQEEKTLPEGLMKLISRPGFFGRDSNKDLDPDTIQTIICFRELCALCWMLHVRDQLSLHCRKYQAARQHDISEDSPGNSANVAALHWACRLLPFTHFLSEEEVLQDVMLSLLSELPPVSLVADTLVRAFPQEEESVRVSLREKYKLLLQRLGHCKLLGTNASLKGCRQALREDGEEPMMSFIQGRKRHRRKHLARLQRHLAPPVLHLWEKVEEQEDRGGRNDTATSGQLSLGTTVDTSTATELNQPVRSGADTAEDTSETISTKQHRAAVSRLRRSKKDRQKMTSKTDSVLKENTNTSGEREKEQLPLPAVGSWEFELEDEEYLNFLELFLGYVLEKDATDGMDCGDEIPLLKGFCSQLREKELHSLTFDVVSSIHRRQRGGHLLERKHLGKPPSVFRAGCCYKPVKQDAMPDPQTSSVWSEAPVVRSSLSVGRRTEKQRGLFGHRQQNVSSARLKEASVGSEASFVQNAFTTENPSPGFSSSVEAVTDLQQGLDPELEARFPELGRLLEWMVRWADRRILLGHHGNKKKDMADEQNEGVVIRVKTAAPAILTSLSLLEHRYASQPQTDHYTSYSQAPEMQWAVPPVLHSGVERKTERESSVDTGYRGSTNTPITGLNPNLQRGEATPILVPDQIWLQNWLCVSCAADLKHLGNKKKLAMKATFCGFSNFIEQRFSNCSKTQENNTTLILGRESHIPRSRPLMTWTLRLKEKSALTFADRSGSSKSVEVLLSDSVQDTSKDVCSPEMPHRCPPINSEPAPSAIHPKPAPPSKSSDLGAVLLPTPAADQPQISPAGGPPADAATSALPLISPTMRQRLGEDLFRLVQTPVLFLQHINYMSLNEVLGASFSSLQMAQQNFLQLNMNLSSAARINPEPNAFPVQTSSTAAPQTQTCVPKPESNEPQLDQIGYFGDCTFWVFVSDSKLHSHTRFGFQEMQPLSVQAESPQTQQRGGRRLIPSSDGLLATSDRSQPAQHQPYDSSVHTGSTAQMSGLKLLKLHHFAMAEYSARHYAAQHAQAPHTANLKSNQPKATHYDQSTWKKKGGEQRNVFSVQTKHLLFNPAPDPAPRTGQFFAQAFPLHPAAFPTQKPEPMHGLRLLQLRDPPPSSFSFPKLITAAIPAVIPSPVTEVSIIKLLHIESGPKMMAPQNIPSKQKTRLTMELTTKEKLRQDQMQIPRPDHSDEGSRNLTSTPCLSSVLLYRQKRREEKRINIEVSFRPNDSIIPTKEVEGFKSNLFSGTVIPGSSDHLLTGQRLLDKVFSTSAELHAFASTSKRPPECHDAFTNTEPAVAPTLETKSISVQTSTMTGSPKMDRIKKSAYVSVFFKLVQSPCNFPEAPVQVENQQKSETFLDLGGRQFISVLDLEDVRQSEDLPPCPGSEAADVSSSPTSAQLHVLATSVISSAAEEKSDTTEVPEVSLSFSPSEPARAAERITLQDDALEDPSASEICRAIKAQSLVPDGAPSAPATAWFSSRLSEMDSQLAALQNIADNLEMDFSKSRMLVNAIEKLSSDRESDPKATAGVYIFVILKSILEIYKASPTAPDPDLLRALKECEEVKEQEEKHVLHDDSGSSAIKPSRHYSASPFSQSSGPSSLQAPGNLSSTGKKEHFYETSDLSNEEADGNLSQTGLSDTMEILDDLVKEGYLSPSEERKELEGAVGRQDQREDSWTLEKRSLPTEEREELRIWMRQKQRERLTAYKKHRQSLRDRERKPFCGSSAELFPNKKTASIVRSRQEKEKLMLLKRYFRRTKEACHLAKDTLTS